MCYVIGHIESLKKEVFNIYVCLCIQKMYQKEIFYSSSGCIFVVGSCSRNNAN
jgi:hypothetical protein